MEGEEVKRFDVFAHDNSRVLCVEEPAGAWVEYDDVEKLQAELAEAKAAMDFMQGQRDEARSLVREAYAFVFVAPLQTKIGEAMARWRK